MRRSGLRSREQTLPDDHFSGSPDSPRLRFDARRRSVGTHDYFCNGSKMPRTSGYHGSVCASVGPLF
jgi:hypothetical protein